MVKRVLIGLLALALLGSSQAMAGWYRNAPHYFVTPPPGPVHVLHPSYVKPFGIAPDNLGVYYQRTEIGKVCRFGPSYHHDRCWLRSARPIGDECGCPPPSFGAPWVTGEVASQ